MAPFVIRPSRIRWEGEALVRFCCAGDRDAVSKQMNAPDRIIRTIMKNLRKTGFADIHMPRAPLAWSYQCRVTG